MGRRGPAAGEEELPTVLAAVAVAVVAAAEVAAAAGVAEGRPWRQRLQGALAAAEVAAEH